MFKIHHLTPISTLQKSEEPHSASQKKSAAITQSSLSSSTRSSCCTPFHFIYNKIIKPFISWIKYLCCCSTQDPNFTKVDSSYFYSHQQLTKSDVEQLKKRGIRTLINLDTSSFDPILIKKMDFDLFSISSNSDEGALDSIREFLEIAKDPYNHPLFIHSSSKEKCQLFVAAAHIAIKKMSAGDAMQKVFGDSRPKSRNILYGLERTQFKTAPLVTAKILPTIFQVYELSFYHLSRLRYQGVKSFIAFAYDADLVQNIERLELFCDLIASPPTHEKMIQFLKTIHHSLLDREPLYLYNPPAFYNALIECIFKGMPKEEALARLVENEDPWVQTFARLDLEALRKESIPLGDILD